MVSPIPSFASIPGTQPACTYYQLLNISPDEQDPVVIEEAALGRNSHVRAYQLKCEAGCTFWLNQIAQALITLLDPVRRREYDRSLGTPPGEGMPESRLPRRRPMASEEGALRLLIGEGRTCDVKLVYLVRSRTCSYEGPGRPFQDEP